MAVSFPRCACEEAFNEKGSHGPVADDEIIRLFLTSRSDIDAKKSTQLASRTFKASSLQKAYKNGLSAYRLSFASKGELEIAAKILFDGKVEKDGEYGGVLGVMDFPVSCVRVSPDGTPPFCVFDTPLDRIKRGEFRRPSHCDVANSQPFENNEDKVAARRIMFNQIKAAGNMTRAEDVQDCDISQFLPAVAN